MSFIDVLVKYSRFFICTVLWLIQTNRSYRISSLVFSKSLAMVNLLALYGLYKQRKGYSKLLELSETAVEEIGRCFVGAFCCCVALFFGVGETPASFALFVYWSTIRDYFSPFTGLQMFYQLPETTILFSLASLAQIYSPLPLVISQQIFVFRLMLAGGMGKIANSNSSWLRGSAMNYHYWTTCLPNPLSPLFHSLPVFVHKIETKMTLLIEGEEKKLDLSLN